VSQGADSEAGRAVEAPSRAAALAVAPAGAWGRPIGYAVSAALVALVTALGVAAAAFGNLTNLALLYLVPVMAAATLYGLRAGLFTGLLSSLAYNFFFLPPLHSFTIRDPENLLTLLVLLGVALVTSQLAARVRQQADLAELSAGRNAALAGFARSLAGLSTEVEVGQALAAEAAALLGVDAVLLLKQDGGLAPCAASAPDHPLGTIERAAADWALDNAQPAGRGAETLAASEWRFEPLLAGGRPLGVLGIARPDGGEPLRAELRPLLAGLIDQAALSLGRIRLAAELANVAQLEERDRLRAALLSSVSHDLRTPLTTILAAAGQLKAARGEPVDPALADGLLAEAERLDRFVANLLGMARVEAGALRLNSETVDLTDAVAAALQDLRNRLDGHPLRLDVPVDLPLVRADPQLLHHILINLLDNAGKYADPTGAIAIRGSLENGGIGLAVIDEGPGLPAGREADLFETFTRLEGSDRKGGTGLGLAIVRGFAAAMGLQVTAANRADGKGAAFALHFPEALIVRAPADAAS
jgi:two-component system sensor histidine kinase KdpD